MNKKSLTETDIRSKFITPAIVGANGDKWNLQTQIREEVYFTRGRVMVRGKTVKRGEAKKADYILSYKPNLPLAIVEAKDNTFAVGAGMQQALAYAEILDIPFVYSSNGDGFLEHDRTKTPGIVTRELALEDFPTPDELWLRYRGRMCRLVRDGISRRRSSTWSSSEDSDTHLVALFLQRSSSFPTDAPLSRE